MLTSRSKAVIVVNSVFPFVAALTVALRLYARTRRTLCLKSSDYTIIVALTITVAHSMAYIYCVTNGGMGQHIETLSPAELVVFSKVTFGTNFPYILAVSVIKISILLFYRSVFPTRKFHLITNVIGAIVLLWTISFFFAVLFQAWPISMNWDHTQSGKMINYSAMYFAQASTELALDVIILTLPWTVIWTLRLPTTRKWMVSGIFTLGAVTCVASGLRIYYFHATHTSASQDFTYETYNIFICTTIEPCMGVICASLPALAPLFQGGHSMHSLIGNVRSFVRDSAQFYRIKGRISIGNDKQDWKPSNNSSVKSYQEIPDGAVVLARIHEGKPDDIEAQNGVAEKINVPSEIKDSENGEMIFVTDLSKEYEEYRGDEPESKVFGCNSIK